MKILCHYAKKILLMLVPKPLTAKCFGYCSCAGDEYVKSYRASGSALERD